MDRLDLDRIYHWLSTDAYWAKGRSREKIERAIANSLNFGAYDASGAQVGFARVVTDQATFAWLCDVYVTPAARGQGIATKLVRAALDHLEPYELTRVLLATLDAHPLYAKLGFQPLAYPQRWMSTGND